MTRSTNAKGNIAAKHVEAAMDAEGEERRRNDTALAQHRAVHTGPDHTVHANAALADQDAATLADQDAGAVADADADAAANALRLRIERRRAAIAMVLTAEDILDVQANAAPDHTVRVAAALAEQRAGGVAEQDAGDVAVADADADADTDADARRLRIERRRAVIAMVMGADAIDADEDEDDRRRNATALAQHRAVVAMDRDAQLEDHPGVLANAELDHAAPDHTVRAAAALAEQRAGGVAHQDAGAVALTDQDAAADARRLRIERRRAAIAMVFGADSITMQLANLERAVHDLTVEVDEHRRRMERLYVIIPMVRGAEYPPDNRPRIISRQTIHGRNAAPLSCPT